MAEYKTGCLSCGGQLVREDGEVKCFQCGRPHPGMKGVARFYDSHRGEILKDLETLGSQKALKKWRIASGTMTGLRRRWEREGFLMSPAVEIPGPTRLLPGLPEWSDTWPESVKVEWLKIWLYLVIRYERGRVKSVKDGKAGG